MSSRLKNGRFVSKKNAGRINKALERMSAAKQKNIHNAVCEEGESLIFDENSIVSLRELAKNLKCNDCKHLLDMEKMSDFQREGLHSNFKVKCDNCNKCNLVNTGQIRNDASEINTAVILGSIHAGVGNTSLNKILACANLPRISDHIYKKYENMIGKAIEVEARDSCKRAALEEIGDP